MSNGPDRYVYVVDDDQAVRESMLVLLDAENVAARAFVSAEDFLSRADLSLASCLVFDMHMPGMSGLALLAEIRRRGLAVPAVILTGRGDPVLDHAARQLDALMLAKPPNDDELLPFILAACRGKPR